MSLRFDVEVVIKSYPNHPGRKGGGSLPRNHGSGGGNGSAQTPQEVEEFLNNYFPKADPNNPAITRIPKEGTHEYQLMQMAQGNKSLPNNSLFKNDLEFLTTLYDTSTDPVIRKMAWNDLNVERKADALKYKGGAGTAKSMIDDLISKGFEFERKGSGLQTRGFMINKETKESTKLPRGVEHDYAELAMIRKAQKENTKN